jgi:hypothetical protein
MKANGGVDVKIHIFLTSALVGGEWSASRPGRFQNAGQNYGIKIANRYFENVAKCKHLGTTLTSQNLIEEGIQRRMNSGNAIFFKSTT